MPHGSSCWEMSPRVRIDDGTRTVRPDHWLIDRPIDWLTDRLIDWLIFFVVVSFASHLLSFFLSFPSFLTFFPYLLSLLFSFVCAVFKGILNWQNYLWRIVYDFIGWNKGTFTAAPLEEGMKIHLEEELFQQRNFHIKRVSWVSHSFLIHFWTRRKPFDDFFLFLCRCILLWINSTGSIPPWRKFRSYQRTWEWVSLR